MKTILSAVLAALAVPALATEVTVYNSNLGLIKDVRSFNIKSGISELKVEDVAAQIDATSVHFKSLTAPDAVTVLEQDFRYDLASPDAILNRYLGKEIELERTLGLGGDKTERIKGVLLSNSGGRVLQSNGKILINPAGSPVLPELPDGLLTKPTLVWKLNSTKGGSHEGEISYLTSGLSWSADYVLVVDKDDAKGDMTAWTTVTNNSGATFKDAKLKLVAGDVHRAPRPMAYALGGMMAKAAMAPREENMTEKTFFEYHMYTLTRPTTLADNSSKQVEMASAANVPIRKLYIYDGAQGFGWWGGDAGNWDPNYGAFSGNKKVSVFLELLNKKSDGLGMPLPKGRLRVYKKDDDGQLQFAGEDAIDHTPKDEKIRVKMGEAFDFVGERKRVDFASDEKRRKFEETFEIRLRNHKDSDASVTVVEHLYRWTNWKIVNASAKWTKKDAQTIEFDTPVKKDGEAVVTYTVRYSW